MQDYLLRARARGAGRAREMPAPRRRDVSVRRQVGDTEEIMTGKAEGRRAWWKDVAGEEGV